MTPGSARQWAVRASGGEDITILRTLGAMPSPEVLGARSMNQLTSDLAAILTELGTAAADPGAPLDEYDALYGDPHGDRRAAEVEGAARRVEEMPEDELYRTLFGQGD